MFDRWIRNKLLMYKINTMFKKYLNFAGDLFPHKSYKDHCKWVMFNWGLQSNFHIHVRHFRGCKYKLKIDQNGPFTTILITFVR